MNTLHKPDVFDKVVALRKILGCSPSDLIVRHVGALVLRDLTSTCSHALVGIPKNIFDNLGGRGWVDHQGREIIEIAGVLVTPTLNEDVLLRGEWTQLGEEEILSLCLTDLEEELSGSADMADIIHHDLIVNHLKAA